VSTTAFPPLSACPLGGAPALLGSGSSGSIAYVPGLVGGEPWFSFGASVSNPSAVFPIALQVAGNWLSIDSPIIANAVQLNGSPSAASSLSWLAYNFQPYTPITVAALLAAVEAGYAANSSWITPLPASWSSSQTSMQMAI
jgi:hypothetical protein